MRRLNLWFAGAAVVLLVGTMLLILADYNREWRGYQQRGNAWLVAMTTEAAADANDAATQRQKSELEAKRAELTASLPHDDIRKAQEDYTKALEEKKKLDLKAAVKKGEIGPLTQQIERQTIALGADHPQVPDLINKRAKIESDYNQDARAIAEAEKDMVKAQDAIAQMEIQVLAIQKQIDGIERQINAVNEKLATLNPTGLAKLGHKLRNAPLLDWFNPSEKVQQVVVPGVRTDLNFLTVETIDRCQSCHVNIDNPAFEETNLLMFAERQLARATGQDVDAVNHPVVLRKFWEGAAQAAGLDSGLAQARQGALDGVNATRKAKGEKEIKLDALDAELDRIAGYIGEDRAEWYKPLGYYLQDVKGLLLRALGDEAFGQLRGLYRHELVREYNAARRDRGLPDLSASPVLLGHPRMDLYVEPDSKHPMKTVGCTSCHEGAGQETQFIHTAHSPREMWVDAATGAPVPQALIARDHEKVVAHAKPQALQLAAAEGDAAQIAVATHEHGHEDGVLSVHHDINLADPHDPAPFAPAHGAHGHAAYVLPGTDKHATAVTQEEYWKKAYGWAHIHYMHWEKPMHSLEYVESSCNRCHTGVFDIKAEAPKLFEGRKLFVQMGCAGCHAVTDVQSAADFKLMGPSLTHVKHKLSHEMLASWIWSPKAFRPMTRMPHFFMLENNSSPVDILRTRVETTAMAHYLLHAEPNADYYKAQDKPVPTYKAQEPPALPEDQTKDQAERGKVIFNSVGCLACHTNMEEHGKQWIVEDLMQRKSLTLDEAQAEMAALGKDDPDGGYNARQWYAMEHLRHKITQVGPEISGVGTKLLAGRTREQAKAWVYDWVRNPQHYSDYSIMPSLRLTEREASDLAEYLLAQQRPGYTPDKFAMGDDEKAMLGKLVELLDPAKTISRTEQNEQMMFLGQKMISHYGCNGCHIVPGMEDLASACTSLDDWGLKDPHKLDFGYFDHAFDKARTKPFTVHRVAHEGLTADAPHITPESGKLKTETVAWEGMHALERRPWLYQKMHNSRVYDRGRTQLDGAITEMGIEPGKPYDKLKMPKFFLTDAQAQALVTFVTSVRKPLISDELIVGNTPENKMLAHGRQTAEMFNCYGCHNIEGNNVLMQQYFDVLKPDGTFNYDHLNNAPPRLLGQGSKTQPDWLAHFLNNVHPLRPWLRIRMPSYPFQPDTTQNINDYFASASHSMADHMGGIVEPIEGQIRNNNEQINLLTTRLEELKAQGGNADEIEKTQKRIKQLQLWFEQVAINAPVQRLKTWGLKLDLIKPTQIDPRNRDMSDADRLTVWDKLLKDVKFLTNLNEVRYPFPMTPRPSMTPDQFARGQELFNELRCYQCHAVGDEATLAKLHELETGGKKAAPPPAADDDDGYGDAPEPAKPQAAADDGDGYGGDDGYGETPGATAKAGVSIDDVLPVQLIGGKLYTAPNLIYAANRLRWEWFHKWLMEPATIQPGTAMPQWFPGGHSAFAGFPPAARDRAESMYGYSGEDQMRLLMEYVYALGYRNYTPGAEKLYGVEQPKVEIKPLEKPAAPHGAAVPTGETPSTAEPAAAVTPAETPKPVVEAVTSSIELHDSTIDYEGTRVVGVIKFEGQPEKRKVIRVDQDPFCVDAHRDGPRVLNEDLIVSTKGELKNAFIVVKSGLGPGPHPVPPEKAKPVLDQHGCLYIPHVMGIVAGQELLILNSDNTLHNVKMDSGSNGSFNEGMPVAGMQIKKPFAKPEMGIRFACNVHPWMGATLHVVEHPFFAVSDIEGRFEIKGVPPGNYTLEVTHGMTTVGTINATVEANKSVRVDGAVTRK